MDAAPRGPQTDLTRALAQLARAQANQPAEHTPPPEIAAAWSGAVQFLTDLQALLDRLDADRTRNANAVLSHMFARHAPPQGNGVFRP